MREQMLKQAIEAATARKGDTWQLKDLQFHLPADFWTDPETGNRYSEDSIAEELNAALGHGVNISDTQEIFTPKPEPKEPTPAEIEFPGLIQRATPRPAPIMRNSTHNPAEPAAANARLIDASKALQLARVETTRARAALHEARANLQAARVALATGSPNTMTPAQNIRDYLQGQQIERAARVRGEPWAQKKTRQGRGSYIDVAASYARGADDPNSAARARNRFGYKRGAYGSERLGTSNYDPVRGNVPPRKVVP
jgi:hypothetical protein